MSFGKIIKKWQDKKDSDVVVSPLMSWISEQTKKDTRKKDPLLHISEMYYLCPRNKILELLFLDLLTYPEPVLQAKFDVGHMFHYWYQNRYLGPMGILHGCWKNRKTEDVITGFMPSPFEEYEYIEPSVSIPKYGMVGRCDGLLDRGDGPWVIDLKTQDPALFKACMEAYEAHRMQVNLYMYGLEIERGLLLYLDKSVNGKFPCKEFKVCRDDRLLSMAFAKAQIYQQALVDKKFPECICTKTAKAKCLCGQFDDKKIDEIEKRWRAGELNIAS